MQLFSKIGLSKLNWFIETKVSDHKLSFYYSNNDLDPTGSKFNPILGFHTSLLYPKFQQDLVYPNYVTDETLVFDATYLPYTNLLTKNFVENLIKNTVKDKTKKPKQSQN